MRTLIVAAAALAFLIDPVLAQTTTGGVISFGPIFGAFAPYVDALANGLIMLAIGWVAYWLKQKYGIDVDAGHRNAIQTWAQNQAAALIAQGMAKADGLKIHVNSTALANAANSLLVRVPDAAKHFGLTPEKARDIIFDKLPQVPGAALAAAVVEADKKTG